jgi:hypothetical protein
MNRQRHQRFVGAAAAALLVLLTLLNLAMSLHYRSRSPPHRRLTTHNRNLTIRRTAETTGHPWARDSLATYYLLRERAAGTRLHMHRSLRKQRWYLTRVARLQVTFAAKRPTLPAALLPQLRSRATEKTEFGGGTMFWFDDRATDYVLASTGDQPPLVFLPLAEYQRLRGEP